MVSKKTNFLILFFIFFPFSIIYLINQPIEFQCDSALFYNYGSGISNYLQRPFLLKIVLFCIFLIISIFLFLYKFKKIKLNINKEKLFIYSIILFVLVYFLLLILISTKTNFPVVDLKRPPLYPIFLIVSGTYLFDSLYPFIFIQLVLSFLCIIFIYEILFSNLKSSRLALLFTIIFSITSIPYILIKFLIAEQLLFFFTIFSFYLLNLYSYRNKDKYLYISIIIATLGWLTKWEGFLLFISIGTFIILNFNNFSGKKFFKLISFFLIPFLILSTWTITRSVIYGNFSKVTSVSDSNSEQFFYKTYGVMTSELYNFKKKLNLDTNNFKIKSIKVDENFIQTVKRSNGKNSEILYETIKKFLNANPNAYLPYEKYLANAYQVVDNKKINFYDELFGKFNGDIDKITQNIFEQPNIYYFNFFSYGLDEFIGKHEKDKILKGVIIEAFMNEPQLLYIFLFDFFEAYGVNLENIAIKKSPFGGLKHSSFINPFNAGKCAENNLTLNQFNQYKFSHENRDKYKFAKFVVNISDKINDLIRDYLSLIYLLSLFYFLFFKNFKLFFSFSFFPVTYDLLLAMTVDANRNSKYEVISFTCKYIVLAIFIGYIIQFLIKKLNEKKQKKT